MVIATETKTVTERFVLMPVDLFYHGEQFFVRVPPHVSEEGAKQWARGASSAVKIFEDGPFRNLTINRGDIL